MDNQYLSNPSYGAGFASNSAGFGSDPTAADGQLPRGILAAFGTSGYPGEPSLLEELDINFSHIKIKTLAVLNPFGSRLRSTYGNANGISSSSSPTAGFGNGISSVAGGGGGFGSSVNILNDADLAGPIIFVLLYGINLLLAGKIHFGYIYGCGLFGTLSLYSLFKLMSNNDVPASQKAAIAAGTPQQQDAANKTQDLDYIRTTSVLGYCLLPLVILSSLGIVVTLDNFWGYLLSLLCTVWSTFSASGIFVLVLNLSNSRFLIAYPLLLFYSIFALMAIFVEKA